MKIVYVAKSEIPSRTANSMHVMKMCEAISEDKTCDLTLIVPELVSTDKTDHLYGDIENHYGINKNFEIIRVPLYGLRRAFFQGLVFSYGALRKVRGLKPDLLFTRDDLTASLAARRGINTILETHTDQFHRFNRLIFEKSVALENFRAVLVITNGLKKSVVSKYPKCESKLKVFPDAVDFKRYEQIKPPAALIDGGATSLSIGYAGHLYEGRGVDIIVQLAQKMPQHSFDIFGGTDENVQMWKNKTGEIKNITFHGFIKNSDLPAQYEKCDILLMPYQARVAVAGNVGNTADWMSPMKMFEYLATGRPVISSDLPALRELLIDKENAILVPPDDIGAWERAILEITKNSAEAVAMGERGKELVRNNHSWSERWQRIKSVSIPRPSRRA